MAFSRATRNASVASRGAAYGIPGVEVDGNDVLAIYETAERAIQRARNNDGPTLIECKTYRIVGHHEGDPGTEYRTKEEVDSWKHRCPIRTLRDKAVSEQAVDPESFERIQRETEKWLEDAVEFARRSPEPAANSVFDHI
jgi:TPP-dependent pyruvate/acetoin dehydrogenase alpha subunit